MTHDIQGLKRLALEAADGCRKSGVTEALFALSPSTILALIEENERLKKVELAAQKAVKHADGRGMGSWQVFVSLRTALEGVKG